MFNFDSPPDRRYTDSQKWSRYDGRDILPMWVADMDFTAPPPVLEALQKRIAHGVLGYAKPWPSLVEAVISGVERDHGWKIDPSWLVWLPGVVVGFDLASLCVGEANDSVLTMTPVYPPFFASPGYAKKRLIRSDMLNDNGRWVCDWSDVRAKVEPSTKMLLLCNPHNPVGRVYTREELENFAALAEQHDLTICSDEIHCGLVINPAERHIPIATLSEEIAQRTITLMAPSKTWNVPGLACSFAIIPNENLRKRYINAMQGIVPDVNLLGLVAAEAAYRDGTPWRLALLDYLRGNAQRVFECVNAHPLLSTTAIDATYLAWIDCRKLNLQEDLVAYFEKFGLGLSDGAFFGAKGFMRLNFGCSRETLEEGLRRLLLAASR